MLSRTCPGPLWSWSHRTAIVSAARVVFDLLLTLRGRCGLECDPESGPPQWCDQPGLARATMDQRLSRARRDVQSLLCSLLSRDQLAS
jgi:hypothetical protein